MLDFVGTWFHVCIDGSVLGSVGHSNQPAYEIDEVGDRAEEGVVGFVSRDSFIAAVWYTKSNVTDVALWSIEELCGMSFLPRKKTNSFEAYYFSEAGALD